MNSIDHSHDSAAGCCGSQVAESRPDWLLSISMSLILGFCLLQWLNIPMLWVWVDSMASSVSEMLQRMWWGVLLGIGMVGLLNRVPRELISAALGNQTGIRGVARAAAAGVFLDLCSHGILLVGAKLYERGATAGQLMAFLIASPWNSFSLTLILIALIGWQWTLVFIFLSLVIALISGCMFDYFCRIGVLPKNPNKPDLPDHYRFWPELREWVTSINWSRFSLSGFMKDALSESRMVLRWLFLGILIASVVRLLLTPDQFGHWFGPTMLGLFSTLLAATLIEVCSEGSTPIAADIFTRAAAPGNSFTFLMAGVSTDYTEIMVIGDRTGSWKLAFFLPLITLPQVLLLGYFLNQFS